ncbi:hypothetical protein [Alistipes sp.]|uniref:DUF6712 family protein n=1 Tax=Alistipes sp. TaxID=1872444 RepID=UPI003AF138B5
MRHLIEPCDVDKYARPCDMDEEIVARAIEEAEQLDIKPKLGDELFMRLFTLAPFDLLLDGGEYVDRRGNPRHFIGLRRALAYYVWARLVKSSVNHLTRFGFVQKRDEYSQATEYRERQTAYNDAFAVADGYMKACLAYIQAKPEIFADYTLRGRVKANRTKFKIIGN